jgi:hypothetical protein
MRHALILTALLMSLAPAAFAADPKVKTNFLDYSNDLLIDDATAKAVMNEGIPAKVWKIYPAAKYVFISQVEGGTTAAGTCVVTARVMLMPLTAAAKAVLFRPQKMATAFDAQPGVGSEACKGVAREKLKEATAAVVSSLVKS